MLCFCCILCLYIKIKLYLLCLLLVGLIINSTHLKRVVGGVGEMLDQSKYTSAESTVDV